MNDGAVAAGLPAHVPLLRRVDLFGLARTEEERLHVGGEEFARRALPHVQPVVVDQRRLVAEPLVPAALTDLAVDPLAQLRSQRRPLELRVGLPAPDAADLCHDRLPSSRRCPARSRMGILPYQAAA